MSTVANLEKLIANAVALEKILATRDGYGGVVNQAKFLAEDSGVEYTTEFGEAYNRMTWELRLTQLRYLASQLNKATGIDYLGMWKHHLDKPCPQLDELSSGDNK